MDALGLLLRARLRRWRGWVSLCLLAGLLSGLVLAAVSAGHRTATAFPQFVAAHGYDALVISAAPMPALATLPDVASATVVHQFAAGTPTCACARPINPAYFNLSGVAPSDLPRMVKLVACRMPDQNSPDEVLASFRMQQDIGVGVGTVIRVPLYSAAQQSAYLNGAAVTPAGGTVTLRVVGIEAAEAEFPFAATTSYALYTTAAFSRLWAGRTAGVAFSFVRLHGGAAAFPRFQAQARAAGAFAVSDADTAVGSIGTAIWPQVLGWWLLAGLTALAGMVVLAQALARQAEADAEPYGAYSALGATWRQLAGTGMIATLLVAVAGASIGTALAFLLSPLTPVGLARTAELSGGFTFDTVVLGPGAGVAVLVVLALGTWPAVRTARRAVRGGGAGAARSVRSSRTAMLLAGAGSPPSAAEVLATADEVQRSLRVLSQRFRPTDFYETDGTFERLIVGLNFQKLTFGRSDAEQEPHSGWTIVHRSALPLLKDRTIAIHRAHQAIGAGTNSRPSCFPTTFRPKRPSGLPYGFMTRVLRNPQTHFSQQCLDV